MISVYERVRYQGYFTSVIKVKLDPNQNVLNIPILKLSNLKLLLNFTNYVFSGHKNEDSYRLRF